MKQSSVSVRLTLAHIRPVVRLQKRKKGKGERQRGREESNALYDFVRFDNDAAVAAADDYY